MKKQLRTGKVLVDWSQNDEHKTTIGVYSLRAREHPTISTPLQWEEVERALRKKDADLLVFEAGQVLERVEKMADLFEPVLKLQQRLPRLPGTAKSVSSGAARPGLKTAVQAEGPARPTPERKASRARSTRAKKRRKV